MFMAMRSSVFSALLLMLTTSAIAANPGEDTGDRLPPKVGRIWGLAWSSVYDPPALYGVCDLICAGSVVSTNDGMSASFNVEDILWGHAASSNIAIRCLVEGERIDFTPGSRYLVCVFTNDWWYPSPRDLDMAEDIFPSDYLSPTSLPPSRAIFNDYRIPFYSRAAQKCSSFERGWTNYWGEYRTFITNFTYSARILQDRGKALESIEKFLQDWNRAGRPAVPGTIYLENYIDQQRK